jgi:hypothetical protein
MNKQKGKGLSLDSIEPNAAGVDVGSTEIYVAVPADRDPQPVRCSKNIHRGSASDGGLAG